MCREASPLTPMADPEGEMRGAAVAVDGMTVLAIDGVGAKCGGAATVLAAVVEGALRAASLSRIVVFCSPACSRRFSLPASERVTVIECGAWTEAAAGRLSWLCGGFEAAARRSGASALIGMNGGGLARREGLDRRTVLIQQALPFWPQRLRHLGWRAEPRIQMIRWVMRQGCQRARLVVVQSQVMKEAVCQEFGILEDKVVTLPPAPREVLLTKERIVSDRAGQRMRPFVMLYVGSAEAYKNLEVLARAVGLLKNTGVPVELRGTLEPGHPLCLGSVVTPVGYLDAPDLAREMAEADVLVMPSLVETVGLPMLEGMACGLPIVAADRPYAREVCGDAAEYFPPFDAVSLAKTLLRLKTAPERLDELRKRGTERMRVRAGADPYRILVERTVSDGVAM